ncbi:MAG: UDP-2,3-diacylglucosamine diphosphatase [Xanthomonadales bacterium]|nr:UDP-2,3-diacylglucosamine diphosphatase [Xanthomonadales bacterium]
MATLFISDLHLDDRRPDATASFLAFLEREAAEADALYILGDLFEYWLGDDAPTPVGQAVAPALKAVADSGVPIAFAHGNRDFLLGERYAEAAGMRLLPEEHVVDLYGAPTLLLHGDTLCTDDVEYQQVRTMLRNPEWQAEFLRKTPQERVEAALKAREMSAEHQAGVSMDIMDVNAGAVQDALARHGVRHMIHGHTHRPAVHEAGGHQRIVLGDWYDQGSVLTLSAEGLRLDALPYG